MLTGHTMVYSSYAASSMPAKHVAQTVSLRLVSPEPLASPESALTACATSGGLFNTIAPFALPPFPFFIKIMVELGTSGELRI